MGKKIQLALAAVSFHLLVSPAWAQNFKPPMLPPPPMVPPQLPQIPRTYAVPMPSTTPFQMQQQQFQFNSNQLNDSSRSSRDTRHQMESSRVRQQQFESDTNRKRTEDQIQRDIQRSNSTPKSENYAPMKSAIGLDTSSPYRSSTLDWKVPDILSFQSIEAKSIPPVSTPLLNKGPIKLVVRNVGSESVTAAIRSPGYPCGGDFVLKPTETETLFLYERDYKIYYQRDDEKKILSTPLFSVNSRVKAIQIRDRENERVLHAR